MADDGNVREDIKLPNNDLGKEIKQRFENDEQLLVSRPFYSFVGGIIKLLCILVIKSILSTSFGNMKACCEPFCSHLVVLQAFVRL